MLSNLFSVVALIHSLDILSGLYQSWRQTQIMLFHLCEETLL